MAKDISEAVESKGERFRRRFSAGRLFWGLLFVLIGLLALGDNFGFLDVKWTNLWQLWPLIIVVIGLSLISFRSLAGRIVSFGLVLICIATVAWVLTSGGSGLTMITRNANIGVASSNIKDLDVNFITGAGSVNMNSREQKSAVVVDFQSGSLSLSQTSTIEGSSQKVELATSPVAGTWSGTDIKNSWKINLTRSLPLDVTADLGASSADIDLSQAQLKNFNAKIGATSLTMKIGNCEPLVHLNISGGASAITIKVPKDSGVKLTLDSGLAGKSLADLSNVSGSLYESSNYDTANNQVIIGAQIGVSSINLERY